MDKEKKMVKNHGLSAGLSVLILGILAGSAHAAIDPNVIVNVGGVTETSTTLYSWNLSTESDNYNTDISKDTGFALRNEGGASQTTYIRRESGTGSVLFHFQTDEGTAFGDDISLKVASALFRNGTAGSTITVEWSTDYSTWYTLYAINNNTNATSNATTYSLANTELGGSQDLYVRVTATAVTGAQWLDVQLFRSTLTGSAGVLLTGSIVAVPEPAAVGLLGLCGAAMLLIRRK